MTSFARPRLRLTAREQWFYLLISPWLIGFVALQLLPLIASAGLSLTRWEPPLAPQWVGLDNFARLIADERFIHALVNTAVYAMGMVGPGIILGLAIAIAISGAGRAGWFVRSTVFMPAVVAGVATALMWGWLLNPRFGLVNGLLALFGIDGPAWLRDPSWALMAMILIGLWNVGINVVVYGAAINAVPRDQLEAAELDGAGALAKFRNVTWPAVLPVTFYLAVVNAIAAFQVFTPVYLLTRGGPADATLTTALYTYQRAFSAGDLGYASALSATVFALVAVLTLTLFRFAGRRVPYLGLDR
ncbi:MAG: sugar ABC transporter permease [Candidatus Limnocylindrales bacterium]